eukprot:RCo036637
MQVSLLANVSRLGLLHGALISPHEAIDFVHLANGVTAMDRQAVLQTRCGLAVRITALASHHPPLCGVLPELLLLQNIPSLVVPHLLDPSAEHRVVDLCAAPGGKASHVVALQQQRSSAGV